MFRREILEFYDLPNCKKWSSIETAWQTDTLLRHQVMDIQEEPEDDFPINKPEKEDTSPYLTKVKERLWYLNRLLQSCSYCAGRLFWKRRNPDFEVEPAASEERIPRTLKPNRIISIK